MLGSELPAWSNIQLFLWCISVHHFCQLPSVFDPLLAAIFSQGKSSQWCTGIQRGHPPPAIMSGCTVSQFHAQFSPGSSLFSFRKSWLLTCLCYVMCLKCCTFLSVSIPPVPVLLPSSCLKAGLQGCSPIIRHPCSASWCSRRPGIDLL